MATLPKLEGEIVLSANTVLGTFGGFALTIPAGRYYLNSIGSGSRSLCDEIEFQMTAVMGAGASSVTVDDDTDTSLGKVTISRSVAFAVTWSSIALRDLLGFTGNLAAGTSHTGANAAQFLWLPNCGRANALAPEESEGVPETDFTLAVSGDGTTYGAGYSLRYFDSMEFEMVWGSKLWKAKESTTNESFQRLYEQAISKGYKIRYHSDRATDATYRTWAVSDAEMLRHEPVIRGWTQGSKSLFNIRYKVREA